MDQSFGTRGAPPGTLDLVKNCRVHSGGLVKRCGSAAIASTASFVTRAISDTTSVSRPTERPAFITRIGEQRLAGASSGFVFAFDSSNNERYAAEISAAQPVRRRLGLAPLRSAVPVGPYMPTVAALASGYVVTAASFGGDLTVTVESPAGEVMAAYTDTSAAASNVVVRALPVASDTVYVLWQDVASTTVNRITVTITANGQASIAHPGPFITLSNASSTWDVSPYDGTTWFIVYQSGATTVTVAEYALASAGLTATFTTADDLTYLSVWADPVTDRVWVGYVPDPGGTPSSRFRVYTDALALSVGATTFATYSGLPLFGPLYVRSPVAGDAFCVFPGSTGTTTAVIQSGVVTRLIVPVRNVIAISKPDAQQRAWCISYGSGSNFLLARVVLLRFCGTEFIGSAAFDPTPVVELASPEFESPGSTYHPVAQPGRAFNAVSVSSESAGGTAFFAFPMVLTSRTNASGTKELTSRVEVYEYTRYNQEPHRQVVPLGRSAMASGQPTEIYGILQEHTGGFPEHGGVEVGFVHGPAFTSVTATPNASGIAAGTYVYYAVHEWLDDEGNRHLSRPSAPYELTLSVPSSVALVALTCTAGQRRDMSQALAIEGTSIVIFRTVNGGTEAQLVPISPSGPGGGGVGSTLEFTDTVADSVIDDNEFLYTAGGVLPNVLAPSCRYLAVSEERLWCGGLWDSNIIECSKIRVPGEPYNFTGHPSHQVVIPGEVSGLAYMDGQVVVFCEDAIYLVSGDGPNDQGAGGFAPPRALVRGVGCPREQSASILETEHGILFRSRLGFHIIPRGFGMPQYIGEPVHEEDSLVLSAATTTTEDFRLARFLVCAPGETKSDTVLTLDLTDMQWFRDEYQVNGSVTGQGFSEIGEWPDGLALFSYGLQRTDNLNVIWAEDEDLTGDAGAAGAGATTYISQYVRSAWVYPWGPIGLGRLTEVVMSLEAIGSSSLVSLGVETDGNSAHTGSWTVTTSESVSYRSAAPPYPECT